MHASEAKPFMSPPTMAMEFKLPSGATVKGMGVTAGVTLIVGGGFHGKSTLLKALEVGVYNHIPGDGREFVVSAADSIKVRAEDGRSVAGVNITPFICNLPGGRDTTQFSTPDASGSTSQAANILEAVEVGTSLLLMDEDTTATNFMIRDKRMQLLVAADKEPITPFIARVRELFERRGVSTLLVVGGAGEYFGVADSVLQMDNYAARDVTARAKEIVSMTGGREVPSDVLAFSLPHPRCPSKGCFPSARFVTAKVKDTVLYGDDSVDLAAVEQLVHLSQTRFIASALEWLSQFFGPGVSVRDLMKRLESSIEEHGLDVVDPDRHYGGFARARSHEVACALNRFRKLRVQAAPAALK